MSAGLGAARSVAFSNVCARALSAAFNYFLNRRFVFASRESVLRTAAQYGLLAFCILAVNTLLLTFLSGRLGMNKLLAKLLVEIVMFFASWVVQRRIIFKKTTKDEA